MREPDDIDLQRIVELVGLASKQPGHLTVFKDEVCRIIRGARLGHGIRRSRPPKRGDVLKLINGLIDALAPFAEPETEETAAWTYAALGIDSVDDAIDLPLFFQHLKQRRAAIETDEQIFARRGARPGSAKYKELDFFLWAFVRLVQQHGGIVRAYKDKETGRAAGSLVDVVALVEPCFRKGFKPNSDHTLIDACLRALGANTVN
jgi:hypothetical protein